MLADACLSVLAALQLLLRIFTIFKPIIRIYTREISPKRISPFYLPVLIYSVFK
jgi:hypothetical protein